MTLAHVGASLGWLKSHRVILLKARRAAIHLALISDSMNSSDFYPLPVV